MKIIFMILAVYILSACGVKADPIPPTTPLEFSHGQQPVPAVEKAAPASQRGRLHEFEDTDDSDD